MADAATEWSRSGRPTWLISPIPRTPFYNAWGRPLVCSLVDPTGGDNLRLVSPSVDHVFELGTADYRARWYARAVTRSLPAGVPLVISDDPDVWRGAALVAHRHPVIGVLHADDDAYYQLARRYGRVVAALVCVSARIEGATRRLLEGPDAPLVATIPCGIPLPPAEFSAVACNEFRLIWAGRMDEGQKRVSDLVRIISRARNEGIRATLDIVGDGPERGRLEAAADAADIRSWITFHGWQPVPRVMQKLRESDVLLMTSNFEGMPIAIMEALASGCSVVSTRISGIEDYEGSPLAADALWTFPVGDVGAAVDRLRAVGRLPRTTRQAAARKLAETEFAIETCMGRYESLVRSLPSSSRREGRDTRRRMAISYLGALLMATARRLRLHLQGNIAGRYGERG
jgi:glycosyltransferase involved in cell wall biosynthesis